MTFNKEMCWVFIKFKQFFQWMYYLPGQVDNYLLVYHLMTESEEELKSLMKVKEETEKVGLKLNIWKMKIMASGPITSWENRWGNSGNSG